MTSTAPKDNMMHEGSDGWLFLTGGTNKPIDYFSPRNSSFTDQIMEEWRNLLKRRQLRSRKMGARYVHLVAPEKLSVYPEFSSLNLNTESRPGARLRAVGDISDVFIDPVVYFDSVKKTTRALLYWKTDTHWTYHGCFAAYQLLMTRLELKFKADLLSRPYKEGSSTLDLGVKLTPATQETARFYQPIQNAKRVFANRLVEFQENNRRFNESELHVGTSVIYHNNSLDAIDARVVLFGDSFSEYRPHLLTGMLAETFRETHFLWTASLDFDYIERVRPDYVITESAERFMSRVPTDDVNFEQFVRARLHHFSIKD